MLQPGRPNLGAGPREPLQPCASGPSADWQSLLHRRRQPRHPRAGHRQTILEVMISMGAPYRSCLATAKPRPPTCSSGWTSATCAPPTCIERMEREGILGAPVYNGMRPILINGAAGSASEVSIRATTCPQSCPNVATNGDRLSRIIGVFGPTQAWGTSMQARLSGAACVHGRGRVRARWAQPRPKR